MNDYYVFVLRRIDINKIISVNVGCNYNYHHFNYAFSNRYFYSKFSFSEFLSLKEQNLIKTEIINFFENPSGCVKNIKVQYIFKL